MPRCVLLHNGEEIVAQNRIAPLLQFDAMVKEDLGMIVDQSLRAVRTGEPERRKALRSAARGVGKTIQGP